MVQFQFFKMWLCIFFKDHLFKRLSFISPLNSQIFLSGFGIRVMQASQNEFGSVPSYAIFLRSLRRIGIVFSLNVWYRIH